MPKSRQTQMENLPVSEQKSFVTSIRGVCDDKPALPPLDFSLQYYCQGPNPCLCGQFDGLRQLSRANCATNTSLTHSAGKRATPKTRERAPRSLAPAVLKYGEMRSAPALTLLDANGIFNSRAAGKLRRAGRSKLDFEKKPRTAMAGGCAATGKRKAV